MCVYNSDEGMGIVHLALYRHRAVCVLLVMQVNIPYLALFAHNRFRALQYYRFILAEQCLLVRIHD